MQNTSQLLCNVLRHMELTYQSHDASGSMRKPLGAVGTGGALVVVVTGSTAAVVDVP